ncbi:MAG: hypothetical protein WC470_01790 [Candidatus Paceibacterota bacterium]
MNLNKKVIWIAVAIVAGAVLLMNIDFANIDIWTIGTIIFNIMLIIAIMFCGGAMAEKGIVKEHEKVFLRKMKLPNPNGKEMKNAVNAFMGSEIDFAKWIIWSIIFVGALLMIFVKAFLPIVLMQILWLIISFVVSEIIIRPYILKRIVANGRQVYARINAGKYPFPDDSLSDRNGYSTEAVSAGAPPESEMPIDKNRPGVSRRAIFAVISAIALIFAAILFIPPLFANGANSPAINDNGIAPNSGVGGIISSGIDTHGLIILSKGTMDVTVAGGPKKYFHGIRIQNPKGNNGYHGGPITIKYTLFGKTTTYTATYERDGVLISSGTTFFVRAGPETSPTIDPNFQIEVLDIQERS